MIFLTVSVGTHHTRPFSSFALQSMYAGTFQRHGSLEADADGGSGSGARCGAAGSSIAGALRPRHILVEGGRAVGLTFAVPTDPPSPTATATATVVDETDNADGAHGNRGGGAAVGTGSERRRPRGRYTVFLHPVAPRLNRRRALAALVGAIDCVVAGSALYRGGSDTIQASPILTALLLCFVFLMDLFFVGASGQCNPTLHTWALCGLAVNFLSVVLESANDLLLMRLVIVFVEFHMLWQVREESLVTWFAP